MFDYHETNRLIHSIFRNDIKLAKELIKKKNVDLNYKYTFNQIRGCTPLILSIKLERIEIIKLLLEHESSLLDRNLPDGYGNSPLIMAILMGYYDSETRYSILKMLLEDPYTNKSFIKECNHSDAMTCALWVENEKIIEILLDYNVPVIWDHLDNFRRKYYNEITNRYYYPYEPKGKGYLKLLNKYQTVSENKNL